LKFGVGGVGVAPADWLLYDFAELIEAATPKPGRLGDLQETRRLMDLLGEIFLQIFCY
jgi:hypothetical protein